MGALEGEETREGDGREERPMPSQSRKNVRREVAAEEVAMDSQLRKKKLEKSGIGIKKKTGQGGNRAYPRAAAYPCKTTTASLESWFAGVLISSVLI